MKPLDLIVLGYVGIFIDMICNLPILSYICIGVIGIAFWIEIQ